jgi:hypothetical protein
VRFANLARSPLAAHILGPPSNDGGGALGGARFNDDELAATLLSGSRHPHPRYGDADASADGRGLPTHAVVVPGGTNALPKCAYSFLHWNEE